MRTLTRGMVFLWAAAALTGCTPDTDSELSDGKPAPDIRGVDAEGQSFRLSDYRGKVVLLDFWASY